MFLFKVAIHKQNLLEFCPYAGYGWIPHLSVAELKVRFKDRMLESQSAVAKCVMEKNEQCITCIHITTL